MVVYVWYVWYVWCYGGAMDMVVNLMINLNNLQGIMQKYEFIRPFKSKSMNLFERNQGRTLEKLRSKSKSKQLLIRAKSNTQINKINLPSINTIQRDKAKPKNTKKLSLDIHKRTPDQQINISKIQDIQNNILAEGYLHFRCKTIHNPNIHNLPTISKNGIMEFTNGQTRLYTITQYIQVNRILQKLKQNDFFKNFKKNKIFNVWKQYIQFKKNKAATYKIIDSVSKIYSHNFVQLKTLLESISKYQIIKLSTYSPVVLHQYTKYLHHCSESYLRKLQSELEAIKKYCLKPIYQTIYAQKLNYNINYEQGDPFKKNIEFQKTHQFKISLIDYEIFMKKIYYIITHYQVEWMSNVITQVCSKVISNFNIYKRIQGEDYILKFKQNLKLDLPLENFTIEYNLIEIEQILEVYEIDQQGNIISSLNTRDVIHLYTQFIHHVLLKISNQYLNSKYQENQQKVIIQVFKLKDTYNLKNIIQQSNILQNFHSSLQQIIQENVIEVNKVKSMLQSKIIEIIKDMNEGKDKNDINRYYEVLSQIRKSIGIIPTQINVGLFNIKLNKIKNKLLTTLNKQNLSLISNIPNTFNLLYHEIYSQLQNYYQTISLTTWTIQQFIISSKKKNQFQQYNENLLHHKLESLKKSLFIIEKAFPEQYQKSYILYLRIPELASKVKAKCQSFDLGCYNKLVYFENQSQSLNEQIWKKLSLLQSQMLAFINETKKYELNIQKILIYLPKFDQSMKQIDYKINTLNEIQKIQIDRFMAKKSQITEYSSAKKISNDIKMLKKYINKVVEFSKKLQSCDQRNYQELKIQNMLEEISENMLEIKNAKRSLIVYESITYKITQIYLKAKKLFQNLKELKQLQKQQLEQIENKKYFNFNEKQFYTLSDIKNCGILDHLNELQTALTKKEKKKKYFNLIQQIELFINQLPSKYMKKNIFEQKYIFELVKDDIIYMESILMQLDIVQNIAFLKDCIYLIWSKKIYISGALKYLKLLSIVEQKYRNLKQLTNNKALLKQLKLGKRTMNQLEQQWNSIFTYFIQQSLKISFINKQNNLNQLLSFFDQITLIFQQVKKIVRQMQKKTPLLYFLDDQTILQIFYDNFVYLYEFFPVHQIICLESENIQLTTKKNQTLIIKIQKNYSFTKIHNQVRNKLRDITLTLFSNYQPLKFIENQSEMNTPLQLIFLVDQIYLKNKISHLPQKQILNFLNFEIKQISSKYKGCHYQNNYLHYVIKILIGSRIQMRVRYETQLFTWNPQILYFYKQNEKFYMKSYDRSLQINFDLIDSQYLSLLFPLNEKMFIQILNVVINGGCALIDHSDILASFSCRVMTIYKKIPFIRKNIQKIILGITQSSIIASLQLFEPQNDLQLITKLFNTIKNQVFYKEKGLISQKSLTKYQQIPPLFIQYDLKNSLTKQQKISFRVINCVTPNWSNIIEFQFLFRNIKITTILKEIVFKYFQRYVEDVYWYKTNELSVQKGNLILQKFIQTISNSQSKSFKALCINFFKEQFQNLDLNHPLIKQFRKIIISQQNVLQKRKSFERKVLKLQKIKHYCKNQFNQNQTITKLLNNFCIFAEKYKVFCLLGPPQSGKSLTCKKYVSMINSQSNQNNKINLLILNLQSLKYQIDIFDHSEGILSNTCDKQDYKWYLIEGFFQSKDYSMYQYLFTKQTLYYRNNSKTILSKSKKCIFQLRSLSNLSPRVIIQMYIMRFFNEFTIQTQFKLGILEFLNISQSTKDKISILNQKGLTILLQVIKRIEDQKSIEWKICFQARSLVKNTFRLFNSLCYKYYFYFKQSNSNLKLIKMLAFYFYLGCSFCVDNNKNVRSIQKIIKQCCLENDIIMQENLENKIIIYENDEFYFKEIPNYQQLKQFRPLGSSQCIMHNQFSKKIYVMKMLKQNKVNLILIGPQDSGKTKIIQQLLLDQQKSMKFTLKKNQIINQIASKIFQYKFKTNINTTKNIETFQYSKQNFKKSLLLNIYLDDISLPSQTHVAEIYLRYLQQNQVYYYKQNYRMIHQFYLIIERRFVSNVYMKQNWHLFPIHLNLEKKQIQNIFECYLVNFFKNTLKVTYYDEIINNSKLISSKIINLIINCQKNFKGGPQNWTYIFSYKILFQYINSYSKKQKNLMEMANFIVNLQNKIKMMIGIRLKRKNQIQHFSQMLRKEFQFLKQSLGVDKSFSSQNRNIIFDKISLAKQKYNKIILYPQFIDNLQKIYCAISHNQKYILINYLMMNQMKSFVQVAFDIFSFPLQRLKCVQNYKQYENFIRKIISNLKQNQKNVYIYILLSQISLNPQILDFITKNTQKQTFKSRKDIYGFQSYLVDASQLQITFIIQYTEEIQIAKKLLNSKGFLDNFTIIWLEDPSLNSYQELTLQLLLINHKSQDIKSVHYLSSLIYKLYISLTNFSSQQQISKYLFTFQKYSQFIKTFKLLYYTQKSQIQTVINRLQTCISQLSFLFEECRLLKRQERDANYKKNRFQQLIKEQREQQKKCSIIIQQFQKSLKNASIKEKKQKIFQNCKKIKSLKQKIQNLKNLTINSFNSITRTQIAQLKYLFLNNFSSFKNFFQSISIALGESIDPNNIKKIIIDINLHSKIRQVNIFQIPIQSALVIKQKVNCQQDQKISPSKNIFQWLKNGSNYCSLNYNLSDLEPKLLLQNTQLQNYIKIIQNQNNTQYYEQKIHKHLANIVSYEKQIDKIQIQKLSILKAIQYVNKIQRLFYFYQTCKDFKKYFEYILNHLVQNCLFLSIKSHFVTIFSGYQKDQFLLHTKLNIKKLNDGFEQIENKRRFLQFQIIDSNKLIPCNNLSKNIKSRIAIINRLLQESSKSIIILDKNKSLVSCLNNSNIYIITYRHDDNNNFKNCLKQLKPNTILLIYSENQNWDVQVVENNIINKKIIKCINWEIKISHTISVLFIKSQIKNLRNPKLKNFQIINFLLEKEDYEQIIKNNILLSQIKIPWNKQYFQKEQFKNELIFIRIVQQLSNKLNQLKLQNIRYLQTIINQIQQWQLSFKRQRQTKQLFIEQESKFNILYGQTISIVSNIYKLLQYFPQFKCFQLDYLINLILQAFRYRKQLQINNNFIIIQYIVSRIYNIIKDKKLFMGILYIKVFSIKDQNATKIQIQNLLYQLQHQDYFRIILAGTDYHLNSKEILELVKKLPNVNLQIETFVRKVLQTKEKLQQKKINQKINNSNQFSKFKKLLLKKLLIPSIYEKQLNNQINQLQKRLIINIQKKFWSQQGLYFCQVDLNIWLSYLKTSENLLFTTLKNSDIAYKKRNKKQLLIIIDDETIGKERSNILQNIYSKNCSNSIILSNNGPQNINLKKVKIVNFNQFLISWYQNFNFPQTILKIKEFSDEYYSNKSVEQKAKMYLHFLNQCEQYQRYQNQNQKTKKKFLGCYFQWNYFSWYKNQKFDFNNIANVLINFDIRNITKQIALKKQISFKNIQKIIKPINMYSKRTTININNYLKNYQTKNNIKIQKNQESFSYPKSIKQTQYEYCKEIINKYILIVNFLGQFQKGKKQINYENLIKYQEYKCQLNLDQLLENIIFLSKIKQSNNNNNLQIQMLQLTSNKSFSSFIFYQNYRKGTSQPQTTTKQKLILNGFYILLNKVEIDFNHQNLSSQGLSFQINLKNNNKLKCIAKSDEEVLEIIKMHY